MEASIVDGDLNDQDRWYLYRAGVSIGDDGGDPETATLQLVEGGVVVTFQGPSGITHASASDNFGGQSGSLNFSLSGLGARLVRLIRPMDRFRIVVLVPGHAPWVAFDGLVRNVHASTRAGSGWAASFGVSGAGAQYVLGAAIFNWQGFVHPDKTILLTHEGQSLAEALGKSALEPHRVVEAFLKSALNTAMGIKIGSLTGGMGLKVQEYSFFVSSGDGYTSWPGVCYPSPWSLIAAQSGSSLWDIAMAMAEPVLHEFFVGYRTPPDGGLARPTLVHRPRPFPGTRDYDKHWEVLDVVKVGGPGRPSILSMTEQLSADRRANCFHWSGIGVGDNSQQAFEGKLFWGWVASHALINRFGYCSHPVHSKIAPIGPGAPIKDYLEFARVHLLHYAKQEMPLPLLKTRSVEGVFLPVRPGDVLEDHTLGSDMGSIVTGYVTATDWSLSSSGEGFVMNAGATVERCLRGTDKVEYPAAVRALIEDVQAYSYTKGSGESGGGEMPPAPVVDKSYSPPPPKVSKPEPLDSRVEAAIKAASAREGVPAWVIAHVLMNETGFGKFWGSTPAIAKAKGIGQITTIAVQELVNHGYTNPDGSLFRSSDRGDVWKGIHASAHLLKLARIALEAAPGGYPYFSGVDASWPWICRAYRWGAGATRLFGNSVGWKWPVDGEAMPDFKRYWAPLALKRAKELWRYLG